MELSLEAIKRFESDVTAALNNTMRAANCGYGAAILDLYRGHLRDRMTVLRKDAWSSALKRLNLVLDGRKVDALYSHYRRGHDGPIGLKEIILAKNSSARGQNVPTSSRDISEAQKVRDVPESAPAELLICLLYTSPSPRDS